MTDFSLFSILANLPFFAKCISIWHICNHLRFDCGKNWSLPSTLWVSLISWNQFFLKFCIGILWKLMVLKAKKNIRKVVKMSNREPVKSIESQSRTLAKSSSNIFRKTFMYMLTFITEKISWFMDLKTVSLASFAIFSFLLSLLVWINLRSTKSEGALRVQLH